MSRVELQPIRETPLAEALPLLESFVSPHTGIVRTVVEFLGAPHEARPTSVGCALADGEPVVGAPVPRHAAGSHWNADAARAAALGEGLERYSAMFVPEDELVTATAGELGESAVDPSRFALFHPRQYAAEDFPFQPFRKGTQARWVRGFELPSGSPVYLPADLVYLRPPTAGKPKPLALPTSNGLACAPTLEEAVLGGLLEVIERDCFMLAWYNRLSLPRLAWRLDARLAEIDRRFFAPCGLEYAAVDLSVFFDVPVVLGVARERAAAPSLLGVGAGCALTVEEAWRKAMNECFGVTRWVQDKLVEEPDRRPRLPSEIREFDDHILFYTDPDTIAYAAFLDGSDVVRAPAAVAPVEGANVKEQVEALCRRLERRGASAYAVDVTSPDVRSTGLRVVRVLAPELCSLDVLGFARHLGGRRMYHAAHEAGLVARPLRDEELNPHPHPFP